MKIVILGAGALGSFIGGMLCKKNEVIFIGRKEHMDAVKKNGLMIKGKTECIVYPKVEKEYAKEPDLIIMTVKAYDTKKAMEENISLVGEKTVVLSLQNGLGNEELLAETVGKRVIGGVTSHGVTFLKPGEIYHSGIGETIIGEMDGEITERVKKVANMFNECGIETGISIEIRKDIWCKAIINSAINPLTAIVKCKNGYLLQNKYLKKLMEEICEEGIAVARSEGIDVGEEIIKKTEEVAYLTRKNYSSMLQSIMQGKKTEIEEINGEIVKRGRKNDISTPINFTLFSIIKAMEKIAAVAPKGTDL